MNSESARLYEARRQAQQLMKVLISVPRATPAWTRLMESLTDYISDLVDEEMIRGSSASKRAGEAIAAPAADQIDVSASNQMETARSAHAATDVPRLKVFYSEVGAGTKTVAAI